MFTWTWNGNICNLYGTWTNALAVGEEQSWISGKCNANATSSRRYTPTGRIMRVADSQFYIGTTSYGNDSSYASRWSLVWDIEHQLYDTFSYTGPAVARIAGTLIQPSRQTIPEDASWARLTGALENIPVTQAAVEAALAKALASNAIAFVVASEVVDGSSGAWYATPFDRYRTTDPSYGPISLSGNQNIDGGYIERLFLQARAAPACLPLVLADKRNYCKRCTSSTYLLFYSLAAYLTNKGLLDGVGLKLDFDSSVEFADVAETIREYADLGLAIYLYQLRSSTLLKSVVSLCASIPRCQALNLDDLSPTDEDLVSSTLTNGTWTPRVGVSLACQNGTSSTAITLDSFIAGTMASAVPFRTRLTLSYKLTLTESAVTTVSTCSTKSSDKITNFDTVLRLYSDPAYTQQVTWNDDYSPCGSASQFAYKLSRGTYYLLLQSYNSTSATTAQSSLKFYLTVTSASDPNRLRVQSVSGARATFASMGVIMAVLLALL